MKKLFAIGLLSLLGMTASASSASAWWPCFPKFCGCCSNKCSFTMKFQQANAFTPFCFGNLNCVGCCPQFGCQPTFGMNCGPSCCDPCCGITCGPSCMAGGDSCCLGELPAYAPHPNVPQPPNPVAPQAPAGYQAPMPQATQAWNAYPPQAYGYGYNPHAYAQQYGYAQHPAWQQAAIQQAAFRQMHATYPGMFPIAPMQQQIPWYWNSGR